MRVLVACEYSGITRQAFAERGHDAWSCDLLPTEIPGQHFQGDVAEILKPTLFRPAWDLIIAHPPCTYLCNSGVRWLDDQQKNMSVLTGPDRWRACYEACQFFRLFLESKCPRVCIENPVMHRYAMGWIGKRFTQSVQPFQFGHPETKRLCLWLRGLPPLKPTLIVLGREARVHRMAPGPDRAKERSMSFAGVAAAMAAQWDF